MSAPVATRAMTPERARLLAMMGIDRYVPRDVSRRTRGVEAAATGAPGVRDAVPSAGAGVAVPPAGPGSLGAGAAAFVFVCDPAEAGTDPAAGRYGKLLGHIALALGLAPSAVRYATRADAGPALCFGIAAGDSPDARMAPPLETLRASARARRALWQDLREMRRRRA